MISEAALKDLTFVALSGMMRYKRRTFVGM